MPGYELISEEERNQVLEIFEKSNILVRQGSTKLETLRMNFQII